MKEGSIQFIANYEDWKAIKKIKIDEETDVKELIMFLVSISLSFERKIEENLKKAIDLTGLNNSITNINNETRLGEIEEKIKKEINKAIKNIENKKEKNALKEILRIYAYKKALEKFIKLNYSEVPLPGQKIKGIKKIIK